MYNKREPHNEEDPEDTLVYLWVRTDLFTIKEDKYRINPEEDVFNDSQSDRTWRK
jgi:hypothetical protein